MAFSVFQHTFRIKTHFLQFLGLLNAIPTSWKKKLKNSYKENETNDCEIKIIHTQNISCEVLRNILTTWKMFWQAHLSGNAWRQVISHICELPFKLLMSECHFFKFKINHNILYTKVDSLGIR